MSHTFNRLTISTMDPHTTRKDVRTCEECHSDPRALGLGSGSIHLTNGVWDFTPSLGSSLTEDRKEDIGHALDAFLTISGEPLVNFSRQGVLRTFHMDELKTILAVGLCLDCHRDLSFLSGGSISFQDINRTPCPKLKHLIKR